jgi:N-acetylglutamate synthase-like GNAT family acetyltransferase
LALVDGGIGQINDVPGATREDVERALTPPRLEGTSLDDFMTWMNAHPRLFPLDKRRLDIILANFAIRPDRTIAPHLTFGRHMRLVRAMWQAPVYRNFERVRCPVLMVPAKAGEVRAVQAETYLALKQRGIERARRVMRDLRVEWMEDTDHDIPLHRPESLAGLLLELAARAEVSSRRASSSRGADEVEVRYRRATAKDGGAIRSLILSVGINPRGLDWRRFVVAVDGRDRVVGCGQIKPHPDGSRELASIAVRPKMRKRGVASEVIQRLMEENGPPLWLMCRASLVGFYEHFGFVAVDDPALMPRYFQRVRRLTALAGRLLPRGGRLAVMGWNENKPGFSQKPGLAD